MTQYYRIQAELCEQKLALKIETAFFPHLVSIVRGLCHYCCAEAKFALSEEDSFSLPL